MSPETCLWATLALFVIATVAALRERARLPKPGTPFTGRTADQQRRDRRIVLAGPYTIAAGLALFFWLNCWLT
jgi:hypothetical protein